MAFFIAICGFIAGLSVGSSVVVLMLAGGRDMIYWSLVKRHYIIEQIPRLSLIALVVACGVMFAYLGYMLAE